MVLLLAAIVSGSSVAQPPPVSYIGLYCDENHQSRCISGVGNYEILMWIWVLPGVDGLLGVEFALEYPSGIIPSNVERNPIFPTQISLLNSVEGVATSASECLEDWTWVFRQTVHVTAADPMEVRIKGASIGEIHYDTPIHTSCEEGFPIYELHVLNYFYINYSGSEHECDVIGTESTTWGAIKGLFR
jgi:hypothetical protein